MARPVGLPSAMNVAATPLHVAPMGDRVECRLIEHVVAPTFMVSGAGRWAGKVRFLGRRIRREDE